MQDSMITQHLSPELERNMLLMRALSNELIIYKNQQEGRHHCYPCFTDEATEARRG